MVPFCVVDYSPRIMRRGLVLQAILTIVIFPFCFSESPLDDDPFADCIEYEVCVEESGMPMMEHCLAGIGEHDRGMILEIYAMYYPDATDSIHEMITRGCEQKETAREAVSQYYDKKTEEERKSETSAEDKYHLAQARECIMRMVSHCLVKKEMGMFGGR